MSTLKIREYTRLPAVTGKSVVDGLNPFPDHPAQVAFEDGSTVDQTPVSFTSSSVQSAAFGATTEYIAAKADVAWCYKVASNPTATVNMIDVAAGTLIYMAVTPGHKIAVIAAS